MGTQDILGQVLPLDHNFEHSFLLTKEEVPKPLVLYLLIY